MYLIYFDESKFQEKYHPYFFLGGILIPETSCHQLEKTITLIQHNYFGKYTLGHDTELHGVDVFNGKGIFKGAKLPDRVGLFRHVMHAMQTNNVAIRMIRFHVPKHLAKYAYPRPAYQHSLMLFLERICDFLDSKGVSGVVFGDYEQDEESKSVLDFSQFKQSGTNYYFGRSLGRLVDTIYFTCKSYDLILQLTE